jgi:hypothetical protein
MKYYSTIKKNKIMSFAGKCVELKIIKFIEISQVQKVKYCMFLLYRESGSKIIRVTTIMGHEYKRRSAWVWGISGRGKGERRGYLGCRGSKSHKYI